MRGSLLCIYEQFGVAVFFPFSSVPCVLKKEKEKENLIA